jgi:hypothetical protein
MIVLSSFLTQRAGRWFPLLASARRASSRCIVYRLFVPNKKRNPPSVRHGLAGFLGASGAPQWKKEEEEEKVSATILAPQQKS